ncbi:hypothetical protein [Pseudopedobacter saltans]|uniref:hypothetical protein n=1 Tax=Pseudopedobacter saltans TaxID=151895 RepID=UPI0002EC1142|nr:hypothetical protein [Pseudopedobacter saltans]
MQKEEQKNIEESTLKGFFDLQNLSEKDLEDIVALKETYPYCHAFYLLAAKSSVGSSSYDRYLAEAAANVPSRNVLYDLIHQPERFAYAGDLDESIELEEEEVYEEITPHLEPEISSVAEEIQISEEEIEIEAFGDHTTSGEEKVEVEIDNLLEESTVQGAPYIETIGDEFLKEGDQVVKKIEEESDSSSENLPAIKEQGNIFRYHEERLPYTFLWWLNKTRKQYENIRPYADYYLDNPAPENSSPKDALEHQIVENIFHITSVDEVENNKQTVPFDFMINKQHHIIERFIKEEPHITAPRADKIDTENKAKRSSEDNNELVSETLARVYVEQMLYHKALDIYKKLSLKYPEKNAYFASQIKYLELKVN